MNWSSINSRLKRLERRQPAAANPGQLPLSFWADLYNLQAGRVTLDQLDPETRTLIESLCGESAATEPDPIEDAIRQVGMRPPLPNGPVLPDSPSANGDGPA